MLSVGQFLIASLLVVNFLLICGLAIGLYLYLRKHNRSTTEQMTEYARILTRHAELLSSIYDQQITFIASTGKPGSGAVIRSDEDDREYQKHLEERARRLGGFADVP